MSIGGATGGGGGGETCDFVCLSAQRSVMAMIVPLHHSERLFNLSGLAQNCMARAAVARHLGNFAPPPPKQTP